MSCPFLSMLSRIFACRVRPPQPPCLISSPLNFSSRSPTVPLGPLIARMMVCEPERVKPGRRRNPKGGSAARGEARDGKATRLMRQERTALHPGQRPPDGRRRRAIAPSRHRPYPRRRFTGPLHPRREFSPSRPKFPAFFPSDQMLEPRNRRGPGRPSRAISAAGKP